jgi:hypothetical protein
MDTDTIDIFGEGGKIAVMTSSPGCVMRGWKSFLLFGDNEEGGF